MIIVYSIGICALVGLLAGVGLGIASKKFSVKRDPKRDIILDLLPGVNCGACGYAGCAIMADSIVAGSAQPGACSIASSKIIDSIAKIMGVTVTIGPRKIAALICRGHSGVCASVADYKDIKDCRLMSSVAGGGKPCIYGCLGGGNCVTACNYDAISIGGDGIATIDENKCISCGLCARACPRRLIRLTLKDDIYVACSSKDKGADVRKACSNGCIGCKMCEKVCPHEAIKVTENIALIDLEKCVKCGACVEKCPTHAIQSRKIGLFK